MIERHRQLHLGIAAAALASLLAASLAAPTFALTTTTNANPSVVVPTGIPTNVGISDVWNGTAPGDSLAVGTTFAVTLPAGYSWTAVPTFAAAPAGSITFTGPVAVGQTETWTLATFTASSAWTLTLAGGTVSTTNLSGTSAITLSVGGGAPVQIASLTANGVAAGSVVPLVISPTSVPADGTSTVNIAAGAVTAPCTSVTGFVIATTAGTFTATNLPGVTLPAGGATSVAVTCANFATVSGSVLTLTAPTTPANAIVSVTLNLVGGGTSTDSATLVRFTPLNQGGTGNHEVGKGARKVAFYASTSAIGSCASAAAQPLAGAQRFGFAIVNTTGHGRLNVTVKLKGVQPNVTYSVAVMQSPGTCAAPFSVRTNGRGNGTGHVHLMLAPGATGVWVTATSTSGSAFVTRLAVLPLKHHGGGAGEGHRR